MTNEQRIKNMDTERLAKALLGDGCKHCAYNMGVECDAPDEMDCIDGVIEWLQSDSKKNTPPTQYDLIKRMDFEQFRNFLVGHDACECCAYNFGECKGNPCKQGVTKWLKTKVIIEEE